MPVSAGYIHAYIERNFENLNFAVLSRDEVVDLMTSTCGLMYNYIEEHILDYAYSDKFDDMFEMITELYYIQFLDFTDTGADTDADTCGKRECLNSDIVNILHLSYRFIRKFVVPPREYPGSFIRVEQSDRLKARIAAKIEDLKSIPQPEQRTRAWYKFRHETLTASNIWKIFGSESTQNQLIYSKCQPLEIRDSDCIDATPMNTDNNTGTREVALEPPKRVNITTTLHWGHKYEPLSVLYYEHQYNTRVDDFGCIPHPEYSYIAASPDGINCCPESDRFGRMLEIKNIVNRDITGHPKMEYWVQMQLQMETCGLNECDFLETRFTEYSSHTEYLEDCVPTRYINNESDIGVDKPIIRGKILHFEKNGQPIYKYHEFGLTEAEIDAWEEKTMTENSEIMWVQTLYWKLAEVSCVLVLRNKMWFDKAQPFMYLTHKIIEEEKHGDYSHRAPKRKSATKRQKKGDSVPEQEIIFGTGKCHIIV